MKLEEVLPAMREGRVARWGDMKYRVQGNCLQAFLGSNWAPTENTASDMLDGWTLEPEPKVEWPKGSVQSVLPYAMGGGRIFRKAWLRTIAISEVNINNIMPNDLLALDWEVVP